MAVRSYNALLPIVIMALWKLVWSAADHVRCVWALVWI